MNRKEMIKILKIGHPNLSDEELVQVCNLLVKLASIEFEFYQENNS